MAKLLFRLQGVTQEEADEVRHLLDQHNFDTYETHAGRWGISLAAIWIKEDEAYPEARRVIDQYQAERQQAFQSDDDLQNHVESWQERFQARPAEFVLAGIAIVIILALSLWPFLSIFS